PTCAAQTAMARGHGIRRLIHRTKTTRHFAPTGRPWERLPFHSERWLDPLVSEDERKSCLGTSIQIQPDAAKARGFCSKMSVATSLSKVSLQKGPHMHMPNPEWQVDAYRYEVHRDARRREGRATDQEPCRVRYTPTSAFWHLPEVTVFSLRRDTCSQASGLALMNRILCRRPGCVFSWVNVLIL